MSGSLAAAIASPLGKPLKPRLESTMTRADPVGATGAVLA
jgi:hypothetical protein